MARNPSTRQAAWNAKDHPGLAIEQRFDEDGQPVVATLSHPDLPFVRTLPSDDEAALRGVADEYLTAVRALGIIERRLPTLAAPADGGFGWLDVTWGDPDAGPAAAVDPRLSYWVGRARRGGIGPGATLVLLAANRHRDAEGRQLCEGGGIGLRVVMHVAGAGKEGAVVVRVTSLSVAGWADARAPGAPLPQQLGSAALEAARCAVARTMGFDAQHTAIHGALLRGQGDDAVLALSGVSIRHSAAGQDQRLCTWSTELELPLPEPALPPRCVRSWLALQSSAMTRRPLRRAASLEGRDDEVLGRAARRLRRPSAAGAGSSVAALAGRALPFEVLRPTLDESTPTLTPTVVSRLPESVEKAALNDVACAHAVLRADELFSRLDAWGLRPGDVFRLARLPLKMMPRAGFRFQPDGLTTNAMVQATAPGLAFNQPFAGVDRRPQLEVRFGVTSTTRGRRVAASDGPLRTEYRSLAADPRWAWHEFAHVLQFAATGELEFRFAHSVGDALAAIACDPEAPTADVALRGATFPESRLPRRHDRPALQGWCWCGERSRLRQAAGRGAPLLFGGYFEEQLMSSSLFRLYRAAGGDPMDATPQAPARRRAAAEYTLYLIVRAIQLLGPAGVVPAVTPTQFVGALIDADIGTGRWAVPVFGEGEAALSLPARQGGTLHKVIRWAFEQQGLYAAADALAVVEGVGLPPPVDVYIPGRGARAEGGYATEEPVPADAAEPPRWTASSEGICLGERGLSVVVANRGGSRASGLRLAAWSRKLGQRPGAWRRLAAPAGTLADIAAQGRRSFIVGALQGAGEHEVLVMVSACGDLSNLDPAGGLPCAAKAPPADAAALFDLVSNDNNLALRRFVIE